MEALIEFFNDVPTTFRAGILIGGIFFFWVLEGVIPLFQFTYNKYKHAGLNLTFTALATLIGFGAAGTLFWVSEWVTANKFGLLYVVELPLWAKIIVGVMGLDF